MKLILLFSALVPVAAAVDDLTFKFVFTYKGQETDVKYQLFELDEKSKKTLTEQLSTRTGIENLVKVSLDGDGPYDYFYEPAIDVEFVTPDTKESKKGRLTFEPELFKVGKNTSVDFIFNLNVLQKDNRVQPSKIIYK